MLRKSIKKENIYIKCFLFKTFSCITVKAQQLTSRPAILLSERANHSFGLMPAVCDISDEQSVRKDAFPLRKQNQTQVT